MIFTNNFDPILFSAGPLAMRWYGLLFALGLGLGYLFVRKAFERNKFPIEHLESLLVYLFFGIVLGARLGEVLFYEPAYYFSHPAEIIKVWKGGLASHGAAVGVFLAFWIWGRVHKVKFSKYVDSVTLGIPVVAMFVRIGNFFNSEIYGYPTSGGFGVIFKRLGEDFPRHPAQLYEAALNLGILILFYFLWRKGGTKGWPSMFFFFSYLFLYFGGRIFTEVYKDLHTLPESFPLSMGQLLSIVPVLFALVYFFFFFPLKIRASKP